MVSRKCAIENFRIGNGTYFIPKGMNVVVDVLSIHYNPVLWGPHNVYEFYPEVCIIFIKDGTLNDNFLINLNFQAVFDGA